MIKQCTLAYKLIYGQTEGPSDVNSEIVIQVENKFLIRIIAFSLGDDQSISIQMRGGPEPMMVTSWAQIMSLDPSYIGK